MRIRRAKGAPEAPFFPISVGSTGELLSERFALAVVAELGRVILASGFHSLR
jgi:hypothetical protein